MHTRVASIFKAMRVCAILDLLTQNVLSTAPHQEEMIRSDAADCGILCFKKGQETYHAAGNCNVDCNPKSELAVAM